MKRIAILTALCLMWSSSAYAKEPEVETIRCTCYVITGTTASGQQTRLGIVSGRSEWMGDVVALWSTDGEFIGYFEVLDTGAGADTDGDGYGDSIKNGKSIDVWMPSLEEAYKWIDQYGDYVKMERIAAKG